MMKQIFLFISAIIILSGCSGIKNVSDYDPTVDFSQFKTFEYYGWDKKTTDDLNSFDKKRIEAAFAEEFKELGLDMVEKDSGGDLIVSLYLVNDEPRQKRETSKPRNSNIRVSVYVGYGGYYGYGPGWGYGPGFGNGTSTMHLSDLDVNEGTLICSVYDAKKKQLIWESAATKNIEKDPQKRKKNIPHIVKSIMRKYPTKK